MRASAAARTASPVPTKSSSHPDTQDRNSSMSQTSVPGWRAAYARASVDLPTPEGPLRWRSVGTAGAYGRTGPDG